MSVANYAWPLRRPQPGPSVLPLVAGIVLNIAVAVTGLVVVKPGGEGASHTGPLLASAKVGPAAGVNRAAPSPLPVPATAAPAPPGPSPGPDILDHLPVPTTPDGRPQIALTLDDGPDGRWTAPILQILREEGVVATFCVVAEMAVVHPELVRTAVAQGHALCNHTVTHDNYLFRRPPQTVIDEINVTSDTLRHITGVEPKLYRAPGGVMSAFMADVVHQRGMRVFGWSADAADHLLPPPGVIISRIVGQAHPGAVILLHDGGGNRSSTVAALRPMLQELKRRGFVFVLP